MIQGMDAVFEEFNLSPPSIDMRSLMSKLVGPTFLQYLKHPTDERWLSLDPELKAVRTWVWPKLLFLPTNENLFNPVTFP